MESQITNQLIKLKNRQLSLLLSLVQLSTLDSNNLQTLLAFRASLISGTDDEMWRRSHDRVDQADPTAQDVADATDQRTVTHVQHPELRPLTPELRRRVVELYKMGMSIKDITRELGVGRTTVHRLRKQKGLTRKPRFTDADRQRATQLQHQGMTLVEIADKLGFSRNTIQRQLSRRRNNMTERTPDLQ